MHVGNRLFPYPVLNKDPELSDYNPDAFFSFEFETEDDCPIIENDNLVLKNARLIINCPTLEALINANKAKASLVVECSPTIYRKSFSIASEGADIVIPTANFSGPVSVSCFLYACEKVTLPASPDFLPIYEGLSFEIDRYDMLAVDDGFSFRVDLDEDEDNKVASIFSIVQVESKENLMRYQSIERSIIIKLPYTYYASYDNIKMHADFNNIAFAILAIPVLASCLNELKNDKYEDIQDIIDVKQWFKAVAAAYEKQMGVTLDIETFNNINALELAQIVLNDASCRGLYDFGEILLSSDESEEDDD